MTFYVPTEKDAEITNRNFLELPTSSRLEGLIKSAEQPIDALKDVAGDFISHVESKLMQSDLYGKSILPVGPNRFINLTKSSEALKVEYSKFLSPEEIKEKYPNVSYKNGAPEWIAKRDSERKYTYDYNSDVINNMPRGMLSSVARNIPAIAGYMAIGVATGGASFAGMLGLTGESIAAKSASEAIDFNAMTAPGLLAEHHLRSQIQEPMGNVDVAEQVAGNTLIGAAFGAGAGKFIGKGFKYGINSAGEFSNKIYKKFFTTALGEKKIISDVAHETAVNTAKAQVENGQRVNVDNVVKQGMYQERLTDPIPDETRLGDLTSEKISKSKKISEDLQNKINKIQLDRDEELKKINESDEIATLPMKDKEKFLSDLEYTGVDVERHKLYGDKILSDIRQIISKRPIDRERLKFIERGTLVSDKEMLENELEKRMSRFRDRPGREELKELAEKLGNTNAKKILEIQDHLENIERGKNHPFKDSIKKIDNFDRKIHELYQNKIYHDDIANGNDLLSAMKERSTEPVTKEGLRNDLEYAHSITSDASIDPEDMPKEEEEIKEPVEDEEEKELSAKDVENASEFDKDEANSIIRSIKMFDRAAKALKEFRGCINV